MQPGNRHLWGTDIYTEDSDLVDVLMHAGYIASTGGIATPPSLAAVRVVVQPMVGVESHAGSLRNRIRSRPWGAKPDGCSFKVTLYIAPLEMIAISTCITAAPPPPPPPPPLPSNLFMSLQTFVDFDAKFMMMPRSNVCILRYDMD